MQITKAFTIFLVSIGCLVFGTCGEQNSDESKTLLSILEISSSNLLVNPTMINTQNMSVDPETEPPPWDGVGWGIRKDFPWHGRTGAVTFAINGKGYYGLGIDNNSTLYKNWREYNPITDSWRKVAGLPTVNRRVYATSFVIGTTGYVGGGSLDDVKNASLQDFWKYQPVDGQPGTWTQISSLPAQRTDMLGFSLWDVGIVGGASEVQLWPYHPSTDSWQKEVNLPYFPYDSLIFRSAFTIGDYAYGIVGQKVYKFYKIPPGQ